MKERALDCLADGDAAGSLPLHPIRPDRLEAWLAGSEEAAGPEGAAFVRAAGFTAKMGQVMLLPGMEGIAGALLGLGKEIGKASVFAAFGAAATALPERDWKIVPGSACEAGDAALGWCLGAYRYRTYKRKGGSEGGRAGKPRLVPPAGSEAALEMARAAWWVRDLVNAPANDLGPAELAAAVQDLAARHGGAARCDVIEGDALAAGYPALAAVGAGSARAPRVAVLRWEGPGAGPDAPLLSLAGKGVCFDTGGYDLKPPAGMLRMKKDMGGAALLMGLARLVMAEAWPVRLVLRVGCVENSVSDRAMRPGDVLRTRKGLTVEVGNTDAEGRLVLADLLADAAEEAPALLLDAATLTGAARVALGPDLPALFTEDDRIANALLAAGALQADPLWRLPLWDGYASWLDSKVADLGNVAAKPMAGAIIGALFLRRFVPDGTAWAHLDTYAWNDSSRPGRPEGGEAIGLRALLDGARSLIACD